MLLLESPQSHWALPRSSGPSGQPSPLSPRLSGQMPRHKLSPSNPASAARAACSRERSRELRGGAGAAVPDLTPSVQVRGNQPGTSPRANSSIHGATVFVLVFPYPKFKWPFCLGIMINKFSLCRCLPGAYLPLHPKGLPAAWAGLAWPLRCAVLS